MDEEFVVRAGEFRSGDGERMRRGRKNPTSPLGYEGQVDE
jgi:hypothetical protein